MKRKNQNSKENTSIDWLSKQTHRSARAMASCRLPKISQVRFGAVRKIELPSEKKLKQASLLNILKPINGREKNASLVTKKVVSANANVLKISSKNCPARQKVTSCKQLPSKPDIARNEKHNFSCNFRLPSEFETSNLVADYKPDTERSPCIQDIYEEVTGKKSCDVKVPCGVEYAERSVVPLLPSICTDDINPVPASASNNPPLDLPCNTYISKPNLKQLSTGNSNAADNHTVLFKSYVAQDQVDSDVGLESDLSKTGVSSESTSLSENHSSDRKVSYFKFADHKNSLCLLRKKDNDNDDDNERQDTYDMTMRYVPDSQGNLIFDRMTQCARVKDFANKKDSLFLTREQDGVSEETQNAYNMTMRYALDSQGNVVFDHMSQKLGTGHQKNNGKYDFEQMSDEYSLYKQFKSGINRDCHSTQKP